MGFVTRRNLRDTYLTLSDKIFSLRDTYTFRWGREAVGTRIILRFKELGILLFMKHIIKQERFVT